MKHISHPYFQLKTATLIAYTKVTISVLVTRYQPGVQSVTEHEKTKTTITQWFQKRLSNMRGKPKKTRSMEDYKRITSQVESPCSSYTAAQLNATGRHSISHRARRVCFGDELCCTCCCFNTLDRLYPRRKVVANFPELPVCRILYCLTCRYTTTATEHDKVSLHGTLCPIHACPHHSY